MTGSCGVSEELCYFCREHEMRPLPAGKRGGGHPRCFQVTGRDSGKKSRNKHPALCFWEGWPDGSRCTHTVLEVGSSSVLDVFHQGGKTMWWERRGQERGDGEGGGEGTEGATLLKHWDWKRDLWVSSFSSLQLLVSPSHVMCSSRNDRWAFVSRNLSVS